MTHQPQFGHLAGVEPIVKPTRGVGFLISGKGAKTSQTKMMRIEFAVMPYKVILVGSLGLSLKGA
jgi:hypothetical protein